MTADTRMVEIRDVTARDGLQAERPVDVASRVELVRALFAAGIADVEIASFVSPKAVPAMAGAADVAAAVLADLHGGRTAWALVPNARGAELATAAGVDHLTITVSASEAYSAKNVHMSVADSLAALDAIRAAAPGAVLDLVVSFAFGSAYAGEDITPADVQAIGARARAAGVDRLTLADTTGVATPRRVHAVLDVVGTDVGLHLHDTNGTALLNAWTAIERGAARFDTAVGGLGGSPFARAAGGNLATEDLVHLLDDSGIDTGIDLAAIDTVLSFTSRVIGRDLKDRTG